MKTEAQAVAVSGQMLHILHHTLGLRPDRRVPFRNHYVAGPRHDELPNLRALESAGLMKLAKTPKFCPDSDMVFVCTKEGESYAVDNLPLPPPEKKRSNYQEYLDADSGFSFYEFLGINKPKFETRGDWKNREYRMFRSTYYDYYDVCGDWASTKKEAKASYKAALEKSRRLNA